MLSLCIFSYELILVALVFSNRMQRRIRGIFDWKVLIIARLLG